MTRFPLAPYTAAAFGFLILTLPYIAFGATNPIVPQLGSTCYCPGSAPDYGCILQVLQNVINAAVEFGIILSVIWIIIAGFSLMLGQGNPEALSKARTRIFNAVIGIAVILSSWIIVDFVLKTVYNPDTAFEGTVFGPWNSILSPTPGDECIKEHDPSPLATGTIPLKLGEAGSSPSAQFGNGTGGGGSCSVPNNGACSVSALQGTCFGARANEAARVCNLESAGGNSSIKSGSDLLNSGKGPSYSVGLWQINLTTSKVAGLNCPAAFTTACQGSALVGKSHPGWCTASVKDQELYNSCVKAAQNPTYNTAEACKLFNSRGFQPWSYSSNKCSVPFK